MSDVKAAAGITLSDVQIGAVVRCPNGHEQTYMPCDRLSGSVYCTCGKCWSDGCQGDSGSGTHYDISKLTLVRKSNSDQLALSAAPTQDALKAAGDICERQVWNPDIIPELAKELEKYAASLRTPTLDAEGFVRRVYHSGWRYGLSDPNKGQANAENVIRFTNELQSHLRSAIDPRIAELEAENARLRAAAEWKPISEAPKDGTEVLLFFLGSESPVVIGHHFGDDGGWYPQDATTFNGNDFGDDPTLFMPLPAPPTEAEKGTGGK